MRKVLAIVLLLAFLSPPLAGADLEKQNSPQIVIFVQVKDNVYWGGKVIWQMEPGDILEVLLVKTCLDGKNICWKVRSTSTHRVGFVGANQMKIKHLIYTE